jgi:hypothetical protein
MEWHVSACLLFLYYDLYDIATLINYCHKMFIATITG